MMIRFGLLIAAVVVTAGIQGTEGAHVTRAADGHAGPPAAPTPTPQAIDCNTCKTFTIETKQVFETAAGTEFDVALFSYFCKEDLGDFSDLCKQIFKTYFEKIRDLIILFVAPDAFCPALKFCTADGDVITHVTMDATPSKCENCKEFFSEVIARLKDPAYEKPVLDLLKTFCLVGCATSKVCTEALNEYGTSLLDAIGKVLQADNMCQQIGACPKPSTVGVNIVDIYKTLFEHLGRLQSSLGLLDLLNPYPSRPADSNSYGYEPVLNPAPVYPDCDSCHWYMFQYHGFLETRLGEQLIVKVSSDVCKEDATLYAGLCKAVIKAYRDYLLSLIMDKAQASYLCPLFEFCPAPSSGESVTPAPSIPIGYKPSCGDCISFMMKMQKAWKDPVTQVKLIKHFSTECVLFCSFSNSCERFFDIYGASFLTTAADEALDPQGACRKVKYCPAKPSQPENHIRSGLISPLKSNDGKVNSTSADLCQSCLTKAEQMEGAFRNATFRGDIDGLLAKFCFSQPESLRGEFRSLAEKLKQTSIQQRSGVFTPAKICRQLTVCLAAN